MGTFEATIRMADGSQATTQVQAKNDYEARKLLEAQYGKGSILIGPRRIS